MLLVAKRDGETVEFQLEKITLAIKKAFKATGKSYTDDIIELLSLKAYILYRKQREKIRN